MSIAFDNIPANVRVPLFYAELDRSQANSSTGTQRSLLIGQVTAAALAAGTVPNIPVMSQGQGDAVALGGAGSMLALMTEAYRQNDDTGELWYLPLADSSAATPASGAISVTTAPLDAGMLYLYIAGVRIALPVLPTQSTAQVAGALCAAISATPDLPITATVAGTTVSITALNKGPCGNDIDLRLNYEGAAAGESMPPGMRCLITPMTGGAGAPDLTAALDNLGSMAFDFIACPYTDSASLAVMAKFLNDVTGRWSWAHQLYGHAFAVRSGTLGELTTFGITRNDPHATVLGIYDSPTPSWQIAAMLTGDAAASVRADPATPLQAVVLRGAMAPPVQSRFEMTDRDILLHDGISTCTVGDGGVLVIDNLITTYQENSAGDADNSYLEVETLFTLTYVLRFLRGVITRKYARAKLAADGTRFAPGVFAVTPKTIRADLIAAYRLLEDRGLVQNGDAFKAGLIVQINRNNPNRLDVLWPGALINQLRVFALRLQLQSAASAGVAAAAEQPTPPVPVAAVALRTSLINSNAVNSATVN